MDSVSFLRTENLTRHFGGLKVVEKVNFELGEGEIRAIIGPNGAGKTTFVSLLCGRIVPTGGAIYFRGEDITKLPAYRRVGKGIAYTFQITNIYANLLVFDNVVLAAQRGLMRRRGRWAGIDQDELGAKVYQALRAVGLERRSEDRAGELAYGHQRLLEVAMGLALDPSLLILDEPTQGLSDAEIEDFCALIRKISTSSTVLLIEHNMHVVMQLADRITVLNRGEILAEGNPAEIRANQEVQSAYLGV